MSEVEAGETVAVEAPVVVEKKAKATKGGAKTGASSVHSPKKKAPAKTGASSVHPKYSKMIADAIVSLKERSGSSRQAIVKYILANFDVGKDEKTVNSHVKMSLRASIKNGSLKQSKGVGASGSFRLGEKAKGEKKPAKKASPSKEVKPLSKVKKPIAAKAKKPKAKKPAKVEKSTPKKSPKKAKSPKKTAKAAKAKAKSPKKTKSPKVAKGKKPVKQAKAEESAESSDNAVSDAAVAVESS